MYQNLEFSIKGVTPILMHNGGMSNPLNPIVRAIKSTTKKRLKTDEDLELLAKLEWLGGLYTTQPMNFNIQGYNVTDVSAGHPCIPDSVLESSIIAGAKKFKLGVQAKSGIRISGNSTLIGVKTVADLFADPNYMDVRSVKVGQNRVMRCRPIFSDWAIKFTVEYLPEALDEAQVREIVEMTGKMVGLCDYRPKYGQFVVD